uniref:F5/8 type C domain-containing protein n=1 Tax=viral metagenome TaxID=1070528 RepID=A0A6C0BPF8_9ZZZZ
MNGWVIALIVVIVIIIIGLIIYWVRRPRVPAVVPVVPVNPTNPVNPTTPVVPVVPITPVTPVVPTRTFRYIRLFKAGSEGSPINLGEVEAFKNINGLRVNVAAGKPVTATSTYQNYSPSNLTDGSNTTMWHSESIANQSATIDLQNNYELPVDIVIINRVTGFWERAIGVQVQLLDQNMSLIDVRTIADAQATYNISFA